MRGDVHRLRAPRGTHGTEQRGSRYAIIEQAAAVATERLGELVGHVSLTEFHDIDAALRLTLGLD